MIELRNVTVTFPGIEPVIDNFSLSISRGECVLINGATGSGKSTLLKVINGLIPHHIGGRVDGVVLIDGTEVASTKPAQLSHLIGYVSQNPLHGFVADTVEDEIAFVMESHGWAPEDIGRRIDELCHRFNLDRQRQQTLHTLSAGEAQKVAIAAAIALKPAYLIVDEPTSALDEVSASEIIALLAEYSHENAVIVTEHRSAALRPYISREITMAPIAEEELGLEPLPHLTVIFGPNGSGKTTYLNRKVAGTFDRCGYVPQNPSDILLAQSVGAECALSGGEKALHLLSELAPEISLDSHPRDLSEGQKLCLALAVTLGRDPESVVLDEPTRGLDARLKKRIMVYLSALHIPITIATHDSDLIHLAGDRALNIGSLV